MIAKRPYTRRAMSAAEVKEENRTLSTDIPEPVISENGHRQPFTGLSPERFVQFVERAQTVIRRINRTPSLTLQVQFVVDQFDDDGRPARMAVWQGSQNRPMAIFSKDILRVNTGWFLMELKRDLTTTEFFRGYPA